MSGASLLASLGRRWRRRRLLAALLSALAVALPLAAVLSVLPAAPGLRMALVAVGLVALTAFAVRVGTRPVALGAVAAHLDRHLPATLYSTELLVAEGALTPLAVLQRQRVEGVLTAVTERDLARLLPTAPLRRAALRLLAGATAAVVLLLAPWPAAVPAPAATAAPARPAAAPAPLPPLLGELRVTVRPPAYTGRPTRTVSSLATEVEEGGVVEWRIFARSPVESAWLLLDEADRLPLRRDGDRHVAAREIREPHLVRLVLAGPGGELWRSPPARLELVPDRPPTVELLAPETLVERPAERPGTLRLELAVTDDYGIAGGELHLTLASGSDEQVEFQEAREALPLRRGPDRQVVRRALDLQALGLVAGSELYLRAEVRDGRRPRANSSRSPTVIVRIPVERRESADLGEGIPALVGPELLRSQRQILVDTERLVAEAPRLGKTEIDRRSRSLALDQRALRMRYGILLGQEVEDGRVLEADGDDHGDEQGEDHGDEHGHQPGDDPGEGSLASPIDAIPEGLAHLHDSAESATFFPDPIRRQLVQMLAAMWDAERELATIAPRAALPHERRALELLKEVQQAARVYVARSGVETTPLDPSRRLGGDLTGVTDVTQRQPPPGSDPTALAVAAILTALADGGAPDGTAVETVRPALAGRARDGDAAALDGLPALDALAVGATPLPAALHALETALWALLPEPQLPSQRSGEPGALYQRYRRALAGEETP